MNCKPCTHPQRDFIDADLVSGRPLRAIASQYGCSLGSLSRHKQHVRELIHEHIERDREERGSAMLSRVLRLTDEAEQILKLARSEKDYRACNGAIVAAGRLLELAGRLSGELTPGNASGIHLTQVKVTNVHNYGDDRELAELVSEATQGFDSREIERLKRLVKPLQLGDKMGTVPNVQAEAIEIQPVRSTP